MTFHKHILIKVVESYIHLTIHALQFMVITCLGNTLVQAKEREKKTLHLKHTFWQNLFVFCLLSFVDFLILQRKYDAYDYHGGHSGGKEKPNIGTQKSSHVSKLKMWRGIFFQSLDSSVAWFVTATMWCKNFPHTLVC